MAQIDDVSDHGLEVLKKCAIVRDDTYKSRYSLRVASKDEYTSSYNSIDVAKTTITVSATKIATPTSGNFSICNKSSNTIYIGGASVTALTGFPLSQNEWVEFRDFQENNDNKIYGIVSEGTAIAYSLGEIANA
jgi:hypothetical protein